jgi:tetratricopeptide (TPR) repeat protein
MIVPQMKQSSERKNVIDLFFNEAFSAAEQGEFNYALDMYGRVLVIDPQDEEARYNRGTVLLNMSRFAEALADIEMIVDESCQEKEKFYNLSVAYFATDRLKEASRSFCAALRVDENYESALRLLAFVEAKLGNFDAAVRACERYLSLPSLSAESRNEIAGLLNEIQSHS